MEHYSNSSRNEKKTWVTAVVANEKGEIFDLNGYAAVGMTGAVSVPLTTDQTVSLPYGGELMFLPDRRPVVYNLETERIETLEENPYAPGEAIFPVAAFNSPGYVITYVSAYKELDRAGILPLFSYGAVGWYGDEFRSAVVCVDRERRQDLRLMKRRDIEAGVYHMRKKMPGNRLRKHLETCALEYSCPAGKNFFLGRYEAPLPTSRTCNARCMGCISLQTDSPVSSCQYRIAFTPTPEEIAEIALEHINNVKHPVVSFGQGCEGEPLMAADVIEPAIRLIREQTREGTINMNTNASRPDVLQRLFKAGLDSIRVSINSVRLKCYEAYFRPKNYGISDVRRSIETALNMDRFVSLNYLNCPGFTDTPEEIDALMHFLRRYPIGMIQWRNLNYDPQRYLSVMYAAENHSRPVGMETALDMIRKRYPRVRFGYFNPPKEKFRLSST